ncbi:DUF1801 domain-containing protein [Pedobacter sp. PWIIR3]
MNVKEEIENYLLSYDEPKRTEMQTLHTLLLNALPNAKLWFDDGKDAEGKVLTNPTIGYGQYTIKYANVKTKEFFQIGLSGNKTGISVYVMGLKDKKYLVETYGNEIGKANVTGYCIKFNKLKDIDTNVLTEAVISGAELTKED